jgi:hypothetical protein
LKNGLKFGRIDNGYRIIIDEQMDENNVCVTRLVL